MKQRLLKSMLLLCALVVGGASSAWGETVTATKTEGFEAATPGTNYQGTVTIDASKDSDCGLGWTVYYGTPSVDSKITGNNSLQMRLYKDKNAGYLTNTTAVEGLKKVSFKVKVSTTDVKFNVYSSVNGTEWTSVATDVTLENNNTVYTKEYVITSGHQYIKIEVASGFPSSSNRKLTIDDIVLTYEYESNKEITSLSWGTNSYSFYQGDSYTLPTLTPTPSEIAEDVTYESSNTDVASIAANGTITINGVGTTTITASYAGDANHEASQDASYTLNVYGVYSGISALQTATASAPYNTTSGSKAKITLENAVVTFVSGDNVYILDGEGKGALLYQKDHGFTAGKTISGTISDLTLCLYSGATEIKGLASNSEGLTIGDGSVTTYTKAIGDVSVANQSMMVKFEGVTYNSSNSSFTDGVNTIAYRDYFNVSPTLTDGGLYDITGLLIMHSNTLKIAPVSAGGVVSKRIDATSQWKNGEDPLTSITINKAEGTKKYTFTTDSDGEVSYSSSNTAVATIASDGTITPIGYGVTTITANVAKTNNYNGDSQEFELRVADASVDVIQISDITFADGTGYKDWTGVSGLTTNVTYAGQSNKGVSYIQIRKTSPSGIVSTTSAGRIKKVSVTWAGSNVDKRKLTIYGKNTPYSSAADLYEDENKGTELGYIQFKTGDTNGELVVTNTDNYGFIGIIADGAMYIGTLAIEWDENIAPVTIPAALYTTYCNATKSLDFEGTGVTAYVVSEINTNSVTLSEVNAVPANTPVILKAETEGSYALNVAASAAAVGTNKLQVSDGNVTGGANIFALANKASGVGFYVVNDAVTIPTGKCYLNTGATSTKEFLSFEDDATSLSEELRTKSEESDGAVYDLSGRHVQKPTKGIYLVNGKKVLY